MYLTIHVPAQHMFTSLVCCSYHWSAVPLRVCECSAGCVRHRKEMGGYDQATLLWYTMEAVKGAEQGLAQL